MKGMVVGLEAALVVLLAAWPAFADLVVYSEHPVWWNSRMAGLIGGIAGTVLGLLGGVVGTFCSLGKARRFVLGLVKGQIALGVLLLVGGVAALGVSQPRSVYYPMLLVGAILTFAYGLNYRTIRRRFEELELRKMESLDAS